MCHFHIKNNANRKDLEKFCNELNPKTNTKIIWNKIKSIHKTNNINIIPVLQYNGIEALTDKDKSETLATSFTKVGSTDNYCPDLVNSKTQADFFFRK